MFTIIPGLQTRGTTYQPWWFALVIPNSDLILINKQTNKQTSDRIRRKNSLRKYQRFKSMIKMNCFPLQTTKNVPRQFHLPEIVFSNSMLDEGLGRAKWRSSTWSTQSKNKKNSLYTSLLSTNILRPVGPRTATNVCYEIFKGFISQREAAHHQLTGGKTPPPCLHSSAFQHSTVTSTWLALGFAPQTWPKVNEIMM